MQEQKGWSWTQGVGRASRVEKKVSVLAFSMRGDTSSSDRGVKRDEGTKEEVQITAGRPNVSVPLLRLYPDL